ncbi:MAG: hypothetical protein JW863_13525 [Chitinispirillaceae bacterium]|nr:hypothetical protein [Chitinispirillaceae bacterium]
MRLNALMHHKIIKGQLISVFLFFLAFTPVKAQMQVEKLDRGLIAVRVGSDYYLIWRLLANEPYTTGFNVYRGTTKLNDSPITGATIYTDAGAATIVPTR